ncbi:hypothetical protein [Nonomuraea jabiensis]|uniref:Glyoxylase-like metal-dependent hydrolase (Beta-lactamase superfamily II) n=1 Tax=Nonomuraea jabiensis TaxID=882448 RepID=A0A7W9GIN4_9ACTN|nr:hypothetical protein [Nonomuraea jabiensis]MBB5784447.1 glyoxylase-like metal-dependent hydrolase (beta-lactamase superfamily II) [Nonomuraea jabiensis]
MGQPDAAAVAKDLAELRARRHEYTEEEYRARLARLPGRFDIEVEATPGHTVGSRPGACGSRPGGRRER